MEPDAFDKLDEAIGAAMDEAGEETILKFLKSFVDNYGGMNDQGRTSTESVSSGR